MKSQVLHVLTFMVLMAYAAVVPVTSDDAASSTDVFLTSGMGASRSDPDAPNLTGVSSPEVVDTLIGTRATSGSCHGSILCNKLCHMNLQIILKGVDQLRDDVTYTNGEHIVCGYCNGFHRAGLCLFLEDMPNGNQVSVSLIKIMMQSMISNGCKKCGSEELPDGNPGVITLNYVAETHCNGVCYHGDSERAKGANAQIDDYNAQLASQGDQTSAKDQVADGIDA